MLKKRTPLVLLHVTAMLPRLLEAGGPSLLFSEAVDEFGLLGAVVGPSEVLGVGADVLFAKLGGATGLHLSLIQGLPGFLHQAQVVSNARPHGGWESSRLSGARVC